MVLASDGLVNEVVSAEEVLRLTIKNEEAKRGKWYATASPKVQAALCEAYEQEPYPTDQAMAQIAKSVGAPSPDCVDTFFKSMQIKAQELCGH